MRGTKVRVVEDVLDANDTIARANRADFAAAGVGVVHLMGAPGAGKTLLLERALTELRRRGVRAGVLEGDVHERHDADRLAAAGVPVVQLNTANGFGGAGHLDAIMVRSAIPALPLAGLDLLVVENVGTLVGPAEFRIGEDARAMVCAVTEGEDKPAKYPRMFCACDLLVINKVDLLPHLAYDLGRLAENLDRVRPDMPRILLSAATGEGVAFFSDWLTTLARRPWALA